MIRVNRIFLSQILWTDEATFGNNEIVNRHNMHYCSDLNPHWMREVDRQKRWCGNVWCGFIFRKNIGPHNFVGVVTREMYSNLLEFVLPVLL